MGGMGEPAGGGGIVGRHRELEALQRALAASLRGSLRLVLVRGEAGIGKTALVRELGVRAAAAGARVMTGACLELGTAIPYLPFAEMLRDAVRGLSDAEQAALLGPGAETVEPLLHPDGGGRARREDEQDRETSGDVARLTLFESLLRMTDRLAGRMPLVVILEDVQWADRASLDLVTFLVRNLRAAPILLVMTARSGERTTEGVAAFVAGLEHAQRVERIELGPLDLDATGDQLAAALGRPASPELVREIHRRSGGNPLFAEELLAWTRSGDSRDAATSPRLRDMVAARIDPLPAEAHGVLRLASAAGRIVDDELLVAATGLPAPTVAAGIRAAVGQGLLVPARLGGREGYTFRHDLVREAVASELLPGERARLHEAFALALTSGRARVVDSGELAYHWDAAGERARALAAHIEAGLAAREVFAFETAQEHFERALELWPQVPEADDLTTFDLVDLEEAAAHAAAMAGDHASAVELARRELRELGTDTTDERAVRALERLRRSLFESGDMPGALAEAEAAVAIVGREPTRARAQALGHLAALLLFMGNIRRARTVASESLAIAMPLGAREETALAGGVLGWSLMYAGRVEASLSLIGAGAQAAEQLGEIHGRGLAADHYARALEIAGLASEAATVALAGAEACRRHGLGRTYGAVLAADAARCLRVLGRVDEAAAAVEAGLEAGPVGPSQVALLAAAALVALDRGDLAAAGAALGEARALARSYGDHDQDGWLAVVAAGMALRRGDPNAALATLRALTQAGDPRPGVRDDGVGSATATIAAAMTAGAAPRERGASLVQLGASVGPLLALAGRAIADATLLDRARGVIGNTDKEAAAAGAGGIRQAGDRHRLEGLLAWIGLRRELAGAMATDLALARAELVRADAPASSDAVEAWRGVLALDRGRRSPSPAAQAYACLRLAEALLVSRDHRGDAAAAIREGIGIAAGGGLAALESDLELLARRARLPLVLAPGEDPGTEPGDGGNPFGLTDREVEVLRLVAGGLTNREIGERLFISPKTASVHVSAILGKLGVDGRLEAAMVAQQVGLYDPADTPA